MTRLIFFSTRTDQSRGCVNDIVQVSRRNNARDGLTGVMVSCDRHFVQLIEGDPVPVKRCFQRIIRDPRHERVRLVACEEASGRMFPGASMHEVEAAQLRGTELDRYLVDGGLQPARMSRESLLELCGRLAREDWGARPLEARPADDRLLRMWRVRWSAWHVVGANLRAGTLDTAKLARLRDSVARQAADVERMSRELGEADPELRRELEGLRGFFAEAEEEIARQLRMRRDH